MGKCLFFAVDDIVDSIAVNRTPSSAVSLRSFETAWKLRDVNKSFRIKFLYLREGMLRLVINSTRFSPFEQTSLADSAILPRNPRRSRH